MIKVKIIYNKMKIINMKRIYKYKKIIKEKIVQIINKMDKFNKKYNFFKIKTK